MPIFDALDRVRRLRRSHEQREAEPGTHRLPPGQRETTRFPVLTYGRTPRIARDDWTLRIFGAVEEELELDWDRLQALPQTEQVSDLHCVTRWSQLDMRFAGVPYRALHERVRPLPGADHVMVHAAGDYTTNLPLNDLLADDVLLAHTYEGAPLPREHGGPVRLLVPRLYLWKSAKWVTGLEYMKGDRPGFWERHGYHMRGDPWAEERFR